jgi:hypothetical protein
MSLACHLSWFKQQRGSSEEPVQLVGCGRVFLQAMSVKVNGLEPANWNAASALVLLLVWPFWSCEIAQIYLGEDLTM